ncbi:glycosyltransferase family 39 protein [Pontibacter qinzhouensis]|uniref:Glycosyltransferase family 39 protein n=1 Tax=Pontibacter qinzhouensis TaxID=2603253 RepID=A0A5C8K9A1_9BACT|nr:glycosyltransferase family 39 protein [Pontibacter qinzhouensis]TXK47672.1 glycosyltransferase family 39 protein [Pontibacter qinzhouensis]
MVKDFFARWYSVLLPVLLVSIGIFFFFSHFTFGPGITNDSVDYIGTARNLIQQGSFISYDNALYSDWPPLYPLILAFLQILFKDNFYTAVLGLNSICLVVTAFLIAKILTKVCEPGLALAGALFWITAYTNQAVYAYAWTEPVYMVFTTAFIFYLIQLNQRRTLYLLVGASIFASMAALVRYSGVVNIVLGTSFLLYGTSKLKEGPIYRIKSSFLFATLSFAPLAVWLGRNFFLTGTLTGAGRPPVALLNIKYNIVSTIQIFGEWVFPFPRVEGVVYITSFLLTVYVAFHIKYLMPKKRETANNAGSTKSFVLSFCLWHTILYSALITYSAVVNSIVAPDIRLMSPALLTFIPLLVHDVQILFAKKHVFTRVAAYGVLTFLIGRNIYDTSILMATAATNGVDSLRNKKWIESELLIAYHNFYPELATIGKVYSNIPAVFYLYNVASVEPLNRKHMHVLSEKFFADPHTKFVIWFGEKENFESKLSKQAPSLACHVLQVFPEAVIYKVSLFKASAPSKEP